MAETVCIPKEEFKLLKRKEAIADDLLLQMEASAKAIKEGRVKKVR